MLVLTSLFPCFIEKHGTCSSAVTGNEYDYFVTALNMYFHYNVTVRDDFIEPLI